MGQVLGPHARTERTRDTRVAEPRPPAPEGGRPGEGPRLTPDAPHNGGRPPPPGTAPNHPRGKRAREKTALMPDPLWRSSFGFTTLDSRRGYGHGAPKEGPVGTLTQPAALGSLG